MDALWDALLYDTALVHGTTPMHGTAPTHDTAPTGTDPAPVDRAVAEHVEHRQAPYGHAVGPFVVPDDALAKVATAFGRAGVGPVEVCAVNTSGAGGLTALAARSFDDLHLGSVVSTLRDLDDLAGNAARVAMAARELTDEVTVYVEIPAGLGWQAAVEAVEAEGLSGLVRLPAASANPAPPGAWLELVRAYVEADLPFLLDGGALQPVTREGPERPGVLNVLTALVGVIDDVDHDDVAALLADTSSAPADSVAGWDDLLIGRVRRRLRGLGCSKPGELVTGLRRAGFLAAQGDPDSA
ncbi:hypothetical protein [Microlunatus sp. Y2014]|uniref:hypothetical protein n=1 Tax=Microlunatus sp. Y2014 TaxID=3418488 RepID=UPI003DA70084